MALKASNLKDGVLAAYLTWQLVRFDFSDLLECAIVDHIFPRKPQLLAELVSLGLIEGWSPPEDPEWWEPIRDGAELGVDSALIARPPTNSEKPAKWYLEDGSGRGLALVQRSLRCKEYGKTAWAYLGHEPDERSFFIGSRPELNAPSLGRDKFWPR